MIYIYIQYIFVYTHTYIYGLWSSIPGILSTVASMAAGRGRGETTTGERPRPTEMTREKRELAMGVGHAKRMKHMGFNRCLIGFHGI